MNILYSTKQLQFLDQIHYPEIHIEQDSFCFISGESGCGKSSYLKLLNATLIPQQGEIYYHNKRIWDYPILSYRKEVLLVPQDVFLLDACISDNFNFYYDSIEKPHLSDAEMKRYLHICCANFDLSTDCSHLSGGERQRIFLAIFLSLSPKVLLLDEPTAALDDQTATTLLQNIKNHCKTSHITAICVCHNKAFIQQFSDYTIELGGNT